MKTLAEELTALSEKANPICADSDCRFFRTPKNMYCSCKLDANKACERLKYDLLQAYRSGALRVSDEAEQRDAARWIPVSERLPNEGLLCALINFDRCQSDHYGTPVSQCGYLSTASSSSPYWSIYGERATTIEAFSHWMPLPAAPSAAIDAALREGK